MHPTHPDVGRRLEELASQSYRALRENTNSRPKEGKCDSCPKENRIYPLSKLYKVEYENRNGYRVSYLLCKRHMLKRKEKFPRAEVTGAE